LTSLPLTLFENDNRRGLSAEGHVCESESSSLDLLGSLILLVDQKTPECSKKIVDGSCKCRVRVALSLVLKTFC
jgi:hypothetical protein